MSMTPGEEQNTRMAAVFRTMWRNWAVSLCALAVLLACGLFASRKLLPWIALAEAYALTVLLRSRMAGIGNCGLFPRLVVRILVFTAIVMFIILIGFTDWLVPRYWNVEIVTEEIPFITCLVMFPVTAVLCVLTLCGIIGSSHCDRCRQEAGYYAGDSVVGTLYYREARYQTTILLLLAVTLGVVEYWYFFARYINSDLNAPDKFFFIIMPIAVALLSLVVMWTRYRSMYTLYTTVDDLKADRIHRTTVRFLVICGDDLLLRSGETGLWDTPYETITARRERMGDDEARELFTQLSGIREFGLRYCFRTEGLADDSNVLHFAVFPAEDKRAELENDTTKWFNAYMLDILMERGEAAHPLATELYRIHTITMAWKTYFPDGRRRYPIKHYRPTFRIGDLRTWDVDYDDANWFTVKYNNEDRHFFRLRGLWQKLTGFMDRKNAARR